MTCFELECHIRVKTVIILIVVDNLNGQLLYQVLQNNL